MNLKTLITSFQDEVERRGQIFTRQNNRISELMTDILEDSGALNIQSGLITLSEGEAVQVSNASLPLAVNFWNPYGVEVKPIVRVRWKNLIPGDPIPGLRVTAVGSHAFSLVAGGPGRPPGRIRRGAQIYWTAIGSFPDDIRAATPKMPVGAIMGSRPSQMEPIVRPNQRTKSSAPMDSDDDQSQ